MEIQRVFLDANILFSRTLRDWLFLLRIETEGNMFSLSTSEDALVEAQHSFRKKNPHVSGNAVSRIRETTARFCDEVLTDYPVQTAGPFSDIHDLHIHSAAVAAHSHILVTKDKGFLDLDEDQKDDLPYEIVSADEFLVLVDDSASQFVQSVTKLQNEYWAQEAGGNGQKSIGGIVDALQQSECPGFAFRVRGHLQQLSGPV